MTRFAAVAAIVAVSLVCLPASAEESRTTTDVEILIRDAQLPAGVQACIMQCLTQKGGCPCAAQTKRRNGRAWRDLQNRLRGYEQRLGQLEERVGGLTDRDPGLDGRVAELESAIRTVNVRLDALTQLAEMFDRMTGVERRNGEQDRAIGGLRSQIASLRSRLADVGRRNGVVQLGFVGGGTAVYSLDGTFYSGGLIGVRLSLQLTRAVAAFIEPEVALAYSDQPVGARLRGGFQFSFLREHVVLELGLSNLWVGYNTSLQARSAFLAGDVGLEYRPHPIIGLGLAFIAGVEFDSCQPAAAFGGVATLGIYLPRW